MAAIYDALAALTANEDPELREGFQRYDALLAQLLSPAQFATYAQYVRATNAIRVFDEMTPPELAALSSEESEVATTIIANENATMENRRVAALLNQRGQHQVAPDLDAPNARTT